MYSASARVSTLAFRCLAPLRFGAGIKGKIVDAWMHGLPVVTTPIGAEGMRPGKDALWSESEQREGEEEQDWGGRWRSLDAESFARDAVALEQLDAARGRARHRERRRAALHDQARDVRLAEAVGVLADVDGAEHAALVDVRGQRQLDEDAVDRRVRVHRLDGVEYLRLRRRVGQQGVDAVHADLRRDLLLHALLHQARLSGAPDTRGNREKRSTK